VDDAHAFKQLSRAVSSRRCMHCPRMRVYLTREVRAENLLSEQPAGVRFASATSMMSNQIFVFARV